MNAEQFQRQTNVSRETLDLLQNWYNLLSHWNKKINLVAPSTLHDFWLRHALDSWQITSLLPKHTKTILDMGAGAGFPGLALAIFLKNTTDTHFKPDARINLVEANGKKINFLRTVIRELGLPATAVQSRIEALNPTPHEHSYDVITARAFAPLPKLLHHSLQIWNKDTPSHTIGVFPKGEHWQDEVDAARQTFDFDLTTTPSQTNDAAMILTITNLQRKAGVEK